MRRVLKSVAVATWIAVSVAGPAAHAQSAISYEALVQASMGDASAKALMGKSVTVHPKGSGDLGFYVKKDDAVTFVCKSGDAALRRQKPKLMPFKGTTVEVQGWEGVTVWTLSNCSPAEAAGRV